MFDETLHPSLFRVYVYVFSSKHDYDSPGRGSLPRSIRCFSNAVALEEPFNPSIDVNHTNLLINGQFVNSASGTTDSCCHFQNSESCSLENVSFFVSF